MRKCRRQRKPSYKKIISLCNLLNYLTLFDTVASALTYKLLINTMNNKLFSLYFCNTFLSKPVNLELRLAVLYFLPISNLICFSILRALMSTMATLFVKPLCFQCYVCLSKPFFWCFCSLIAKAIMRTFSFERELKKFLAACALSKNTFACKCQKIIQVSSFWVTIGFSFLLWFRIYFYFLVVFNIIFVVEVCIALNLFLNFEQNLAWCSYKIVHKKNLW